MPTKLGQIRNLEMTLYLFSFRVCHVMYKGLENLEDKGTP